MTHAEKRDIVMRQIGRPLPSWARPLMIACTLVGLAAFLYLALSADPNRAWRVFHLNWLYWTGLAQAGVIFAAVTTAAKGRWAVPLRRMAEASVAFLPVAFLLFLLSWAGRAEIFPWVKHPITDVPVKAFWLRDWFLYLRVGAGLLLLFGLSVWFVYWSVRQDAALLKDKVADRFKPLYERLTRGWNEHSGVAAGEMRATIAPLLVIAYALVMTLVAFDLVMSLAPHWISNLLGGFFFMGAWLAGLMSLALLMLFWRRHFGLEDVITMDTQHDLAKLCFGFTVFWAYLFFSQFLVIWYGNLPEETSFLFLRMARPEWRGISTAMVVLCFLVPFWGLIGIAPKKSPSILTTFALISLLGLWIDRYVLTVPSVVQAAESLPLGWQELLITIGFFGLWGLSYLWFAERFPLVSPTLVEFHGERRRHHHASF
jgi:hypothetical protein